LPSGAGLYVIEVEAHWPQGDVPMYFPVEIGFPMSAEELDDLLGCAPLVSFEGPSGFIRTVGGEWAVRMLSGILDDDVVEPVEARPTANGPWLVVRGGAPIAWVDYGSLSGRACEGFGIGDA